MRMFRRAGKKLLMAAPENVAIGNLCLKLRPELAQGDFAVMDLGSVTTKIDIFSKGIYEVTRNLDTGCQAISRLIVDSYGCDPHIAELYMRENKDDFLGSEAAQDVYSRIAVDVMRAINYYTFENRDNTLETMYYYGGGSAIQPLINEIRDTIQLDLVPLTELAGPDWKNPEAILHGATSIGICWNH
jgi:type IV pilus assembly protein PilM